jgi:thiol-disulfide isomerase/thioredoxin
MLSRLGAARFLFAAVPLFALGLLSGCGGSVKLASEPHALLAQVPAVESGLALDGTEVRLPASGKVTLIDFWATSCAPCLKMMPAVETLHRDKRAAGLVVVGVAADDNPGLVQERLRKLGITYPNLLDGEGGLRGVYQVTELPQTVLVDRHGRVRVVRLGGDAADLEAVHSAVDSLLGEP